MPDFPVTALRSVEISTPDLAGSVDFYTRVWGLTVAAEVDDKVFLSATGDDFHVLELKAGDKAELRKTTFRAASADALAALLARCRDAGCTVMRELGPADAPSGGQRFVVREPQGAVLEFVHGDLRKPAKTVENQVLRLAHVNINSSEIEALSSFYQDVLGFQLTDRSKMMAFLRCNDDHHAVVLAEAPVNGLNHIAFLMPDLESVMRGSGRVVDHGYPIGWGVGRHGPGDNVFAYFVDPTGVVVEYTAEVLQVDDTYRVKGPDEWVWPPGRTDHWGIAAPKSEVCKKAQVSVGFAGA
ncbi:VOC family protein [Allorhizobium taibaishanense]|uniref:Catechol 2,3-dioxygenase n=1 Tax=Allorhizobium taibaishanense TaxID=887144 RepID=A0A1Q9A717_9HYPH|nr:VOC family protein [Allorhizobium taibaishanense]MBB4008459.1 catechol 2,3-dioxygenase [Allorhizobium taibaishanense]OLP50372.1 glyoxalase [Allorhizobium taibaishanense]